MYLCLRYWIYQLLTIPYDFPLGMMKYLSSFSFSLNFFYSYFIIIILFNGMVNQKLTFFATTFQCEVVSLHLCGVPSVLWFYHPRDLHCPLHVARRKKKECEKATLSSQNPWPGRNIHITYDLMTLASASGTATPRGRRHEQGDIVLA